MSAPSSSGAGPTMQNRSPATNRPAEANTTSVLASLSNLLEMDASGKLSILQQNQLRQYIITHSKSIVTNAMIHSQPNPLHTLPPHLDPTKSWEHGPAIISKEKYEADIASAVFSANIQIQKNRAMPAGLFTLQELRDFLRIDPVERHARLDGDRKLKDRFNDSVSYWTRRSEEQKLQNAGTGTGNVQGTARPGSNVPSVLVDPRVKAEPGFTGTRRYEMVEDEPMRIRRRFKEFLGEMSPGMDMELGLSEVLTEVMSSFMEEAALGSIRIAKHRRSDKVEVKDAAFFLAKTYDITVPGFNTQQVERSHVAPEGERKRARIIAPRAARVNRGTVAKDDE